MKDFEKIRYDAPMSRDQRNTADEVFSQYEGLDLVKAWEALVARANDTSSPFRAYDAAHGAAAKVMRESGVVGN